MSAKKTVDTAVASIPTARTVADHAAGMPAANPTTDYGVATKTAARPDVFNPPSGTYPPSAAPDLGDQ